MSTPRPFGPDELDGVADLLPEELAAETRLARDLEGIAVRDGIVPSAGFADRVMGAVALEPVPAPAIAAGSALRHAALFGFLVSIRDAFRVSFSGGFPVAVRAQAFALVLLVVGITAGSGYAAAGAIGLLGDRSSPSPSVEVPTQPAPTPEPTASPRPTVEGPSPSPSITVEPSDSAEPSDSPEATEDPSETPEATDDHGGDTGSSGGGGGGGTRTPSPTERATAKPTARPTAKPTHTPEPSEEPHDSHKPTPTPTPSSSPTPTPSPTPHN